MLAERDAATPAEVDSTAIDFDYFSDPRSVMEEVTAFSMVACQVPPESPTDTRISPPPTPTPTLLKVLGDGGSLLGSRLGSADVVGA